MTARTARWIAVVAFLLYALTGGGRVVGSDEVTMLELARSMLVGRLDVPPGATLDGRDGRHYTKNAAAQAVLSLPLVAIAEAGAQALPPARRTLAVRFAASFFDALVTAVLLAVFYAAARTLGASAGGALAATFLLGFTTPLWVYSKSFMAEPLQALGLLLAATGAALAGSDRRKRRIEPETIAALGAFLAISVKLSMLPLAIACLLPGLLAPRRTWRAPIAGVLAALAGHGLYNFARFGTPLETGYGAQATAAAYTTPVLVGLYGLLLSSGKGVLWFAPALWLAPAGWRAMWSAASSATASPPGQVAEHGLNVPLTRHGRWRDAIARLRASAPPARAGLAVAAAWIAGLALYSRFQHWAGDGSFGPRYLVPLLPLAFLAMAFALGGVPSPSRARKALAVLLAVLGFWVQIGGVSIYFGAQMREAGDYPYTLPLEHPRFMSESHWNPAASPIADHWRMLSRNLAEHAAGGTPRIAPGGPADARLGISATDQTQLLHAIDYWWLYLGYAGFPGLPIAAAALLLLALAVVAATRLVRAWRAEARYA